MAEGALGISTGIGQGEAQIIKPFQSPVTPQQYGSVMAAQQKAKQDKRSKSLANIETLDFKGMPNEAGLFAKAYDEIVKFVAENVDDPYVDIKMKQKISDLKTRANMSYDRKMAINNIVGDVQKGEGKNIYLGIDPALQRAVADMDYATFSNTEAYGKENAERMNKLSTVKTVPIYDIGAATGDLINQAGKWATINKNGRISETPDDVIDTLVRNELSGHPHAYATFERLMKNDPAGAKAANNQVDQYAFTVLRTAIKARAVSPEPKGDTNIINVGGGEEGTGVSDVAPQTFDMNLENIGGQSPVTLSFDADGYSFTPVQASRAVPSNTFTLDGKPYTTQGIVNMAIGAVLDMPVANRDINVNGRTFKAGQPIPQEYVAFMNQEPNKYRNVINFKKMATALVNDADQIAFDLNEAENLISTNQKWGKAGYGKYKSNQTKLDTKGRYKELYPNLFGGAAQPTGGAKTTSVPTVTQSRNFIRKNK